MNRGETPSLAAQRELLEETGLETPVRYVCTLDFDETQFQQISHLYVTEGEGPIRNDATEWQWSGWMSKAEVDDLLKENRLCTDTAALYEAGQLDDAELKQTKIEIRMGDLGKK